MKTLKIYDPAMCCPTGVCGTDVDTRLVQLANFLNTLDKEKYVNGSKGNKSINQLIN